MAQQNDWGWGEASQDHQDPGSHRAAEVNDNVGSLDDGWQRGGAEDVWGAESQESLSQPSAFDEPKVVEAEEAWQDPDEPAEKPTAKKTAGQGASRPNVAILAAAGVLGVAVLGGAGWFAWDMLSPKTAQVPVAAPVQVAQEQPQATEGAQASSDKDDADWLDDKKVDGQVVAPAQQGLAASDAPQPISVADQTPQPQASQAAVAPAVQSGPHTDNQIGRLVGGAASSANPAAQVVASTEAPAKEGAAPPKAAPKGSAARQAPRSEPATAVATAAPSKPREVKAAPREPRVVAKAPRQATRVARKPSSTPAPSAPAREFVEMPQARVMAVYPPSGRWVQAWLKEDASGRTVTLREGDIYRGVKVKEVVADSMRVVFEDGRMIDTNGVGVVPAPDEGAKKARKTGSHQPAASKS